MCTDVKDSGYAFLSFPFILNCSVEECNCTLAVNLIVGWELLACSMDRLISTVQGWSPMRENVLNISILHFNRLHSEDLSTLWHTLCVKQAYTDPLYSQTCI